MEIFFCVFVDRTHNLGVCEKEEITSYSSVTGSDFLNQILYFGGWGNEEGVWCVISGLESLLSNSPSCFLLLPPAAFQGWLSITLTFLFAYSVTSQLLYIYLCPTNTFKLLPYNQRSDLTPLCFFYIFQLFLSVGGFQWINFPHCCLPILLLCSLLLNCPYKPQRLAAGNMRDSMLGFHVYSSCQW